MDKERIKKLSEINDMVEQFDILKQSVKTNYEADEEYQQLKRDLALAEERLEASTKTMTDAMDALTQDIKKAVLNLGETYDAMSMQVKYRKGYQRVSWDATKLNKALEYDPAYMAFRKVTDIEPSVSVTIREINIV
jgi:hypothetical protein